MSDEKVFIGVDVGSVSVNTVVMSRAGDILEEHYTRTKGQPFHRVREVVGDILNRYPLNRVAYVATTGTGGRLLAELLGGAFTNEVIAQARATAKFHPEVRTVIEMGGADAKLILLEPNEHGGSTVLKDFSMNSMCAAGTGSFLDQQASRLRLTIEEFSELALKSKTPPRIAGRCSVFAKSDMIHLQQIATPDYDIVAGLCYAVARNFKGNIGKGKEFPLPVSFQGGVAANLGVRKAFADVLGLEQNELIVPKHFASMGAIGTVLVTQETGGEPAGFRGLGSLEQYMNSSRADTECLEPLEFDPACCSAMTQDGDLSVLEQARREAAGNKIRAYLGVDVGSISTNLVVIDDKKRVLSRRYLMTAGRPIEAVRQGLEGIASEVADAVEIAGVGSTGSGRYLAGEYLGADVIRNEITAQATAAIDINPEVDTIFEIGGQDSKYISVESGTVVDFEMNKVCAAGTGSFLEEQAERLGISIKGEFGKLALSSERPVPLGERCTVFMESDLIHHQQRGANTEELVAGLSYSIVQNYLNRVVGDRKVGNRIFFQGGTAYNKAVVAAFEKVTGKKITVPPHHDVTGAIGAALLARDASDGARSTFKGWEVGRKKYDITTFECKECSNRCEIRRVSIEGEKPLFYGSRCEKYEVDRREKQETQLPDLFKEREEMLLEFFSEGESVGPDAPVIGIPRMLFFHEMLPFWRTFFSHLGLRTQLSDETNKRIIHRGVEQVVAETCFPIKVSLGHVLNLMEKGVKRIFVPSMINLHRLGDFTNETFNCPYVQTFPYTSRACIDFEAADVELLQPVFHWGRDKKWVMQQILTFGRQFGAKDRQVRSAFEEASRVQRDFYARLKRRGEEVLRELPRNQDAIVIVGRPYNSFDRGMNLDLPKKLRNLGILPIPFDYLPVETQPVTDEDKKMYWKSGQRILGTAEIIKNTANLYAVYLTNFGCGPDSFISHFFRKKMAGKPYLQLEIDEHSADAGAITRCEAFLDSLANAKKRGRTSPRAAKPAATKPRSTRPKRTIYIPYMCDQAYALQAAFQNRGIEAEVLPESDRETLKWGKRLTSGRECYPLILTTGDLAKFITKPGFDPEKAAFFMPSGNGPCRFGCYHRYHKQVLEEMGYPDVVVIAPNQSEGLYDDLSMLDGKFDRSAWQGILGSILIEKKLLETRPYELHPGETDTVYRHYLKAICDSIRDDRDITNVLREARRAMEDIPLLNGEQKPVVGIVGEIYVRSNPFSNENIIRQLEQLGAEVWMPPFSEWIYYLNYVQGRNAKETGKLQERLKVALKDKVQKSDERRYGRIFEGSLKNLWEPTIEATLEESDPYLDSSYDGEAVLSIGKSIEFFHQGASGVVNVMPFTCMPGTIVAALSKRYREDHDNLPILNMAFDGQEVTNTRTRLEAFIHQVKEFHIKHEAAKKILARRR